MGMDYCLCSIPESLKEPLPDPFDRDYMNKLYKVGYDVGPHRRPFDALAPFGVVKNLPK